MKKRKEPIKTLDDLSKLLYQEILHERVTGYGLKFEDWNKVGNTMRVRMSTVITVDGEEYEIAESNVKFDLKDSVTFALPVQAMDLSGTQYYKELRGNVKVDESSTQ